MDEILAILAQNARVTAEDIARMTGKDVKAVIKAIRKYEKDGAILGYKAVINQDLVRDARTFVRALIEVSVIPQKNVGFDAIAERIYSFDEVKSCYLVSGSYDLLLVIEGESLQTVADFVASRLSSMDHVRGTMTHFLLKKYKEDGQVLKRRKTSKRMNISY